jgi:predicted HAD superfamily Cof-like phosphohydrolase
MKPTPFQRVAEMNTAFGNPKGNASNIDWKRLRSQCLNILDEYNELLVALSREEVEGVRDALCDIQVFANGAQHLMGVDGDADMHAVVDGVMTRFIKDEDDKIATISMHRAKGVTEVYFVGEYPKMIMKSERDQPDAPKGKFLKSASYSNTVFPPVG